MAHEVECIFGAGYVADDAGLTVWYSRKLQEFDEKEYKNHVSCRDCVGNTLLHAAVYAGDLDVLRAIVSLENVNLDIRNNIGLTPLLLCLNKNLKPAVAKCLIEAGCDVNVKYGYWETTALMIVAQSYHNSEIAHLLIQHGADINATNKYKNTALHTAVCADQYDIICMLLYYGADADEPNDYDETPFLMALAGRDTDIQELLFNYVVDVNRTTSRCSLLMVALENSSPFYSELLDIGADVNYFVGDTNCLAMSLNMPTNKAFKRIWEKFDYEEVYQHMTESILVSLRNCTLPDEDWLECIYILLTSEHMNYISAHFCKEFHTFTTFIKWFAWSFYLRRLPEKSLFEYICLVLMRGESVYFTDIEAVYMTYGYRETLKLLLLMDVIPNCCYRCPLPYFMCNFSKNECDIMDSNDIEEFFLLKTIERNVVERKKSIKEMYYDTFPEMKMHWSRPKQVPRLTELARNVSRKAIRLKCNKRQSCCQFYTILRQMKLPAVIEGILSYTEPIYF